eukprot:c5228_g1_i1.p1 GENE.c5228_g1_i1~~c5228_g1_i1.p1  ORF type:complete len:386 (+),score=83.40 c5228_g1_i1:48-1160(+)
MAAYFVFCFVILAGLVSSLPSTQVPSDDFPSFEVYIERFSKSYDAREFQIRKSIYETRVSEFKQHNKAPTASTKGVNKFADFSEQELKSMFGFDKTLARHLRAKRLGTYDFDSVRRSNVNISALPAAVDWTTTKALTAVKNQGGCGSCWAFAGTEAIESNVFLETGQLFTLAPQQYVDCVVNKNDCGGTGGCQGATPDLLFEFAQTNGGYLETQYPYTARDGKCKALNQPKVKIAGWSDVDSNSVEGLMAAVVQQPVTVGVAASTWPFYSKGVLSFAECEADLNHAVLLVGYGTDPVHGDYWKIQNSWGTSWGENGFIRLARSASDATNCKTDSSPADGFGCKGGPATVQVCGTCGILYLPSYPIGGSVV